MNKNNEKKELVPTLRFPEFVGEWNFEPLGKKIELTSGYAFKSKEISEDSSGTPILRGINITEGRIRHNKKIDRYYLGKIDKLKNFLTVVNDLVIGMDGSKVGKNSALISKKDAGALLIQRVALLRAKKTTTIQFIFQYVNSFIFHSYVDKINTSSGIPHISAKQIKGWKLGFPKNENEQQKIADCLTSLDNLISAQSEKLAALKDHKTGLLQQLFPAEGERVPKLRFGEFTGEWENEKFSKYIKLDRGSSPRPIVDYMTTEDDGVNWIKIGDTKSADNFTIRDVREKITKEGAKKSRKVRKGELILANSMSYGKTYQLDIDGCIYDGWFVLRGYEEFFNKQFLLQLLNSNYLQRQYERLAAGGIVKNISSEIVYDTILPWTSIEEQQKIATCLSSLDNQISAQIKKIKALKAHKKGLMQQLFPNINEQ